MLERYASPSSDPTTAGRVHLVPTHVSLDGVNNYPTELVAANAFSELKLARQNNGVHPASSGYNQIGDTLFAWLKGQITE